MDALRDRRLDEAVAWHVRLTSPEAEEAAFAEFASWLEDDPEHGTAYETIEDFDAPLEIAVSRERRQNSPHSPIRFEPQRYIGSRTTLAAWVAGAAAIAAILLIFF